MTDTGASPEQLPPIPPATPGGAPNPYATQPGAAPSVYSPAQTGGYVAQPGDPQQQLYAQPLAYTPRPPTGARSYALGFLAYFPVPVVGLLIAGIVMISVYPGTKRIGGLAEQNGRRAANWGITLIASIIAMILLIVVVALLKGDAAVPGLAYIAIAITHVVVIIMGTVKANAGKVFDNALAIPFLR